MLETANIIYTDDSWVNSDPIPFEKYGDELSHQNHLFASGTTVFRTLEPEYSAEDIQKLPTDITTLEKDFIRTMNPTPAEDIFEEIFAEALGFDKREYLNFQYPVKLNGKNLAYIDYYLETSIGPVAFEVNGETFHNPLFTGKDAYLKQIKRQNFIVSSGIKVFRWTTRQLQQQREDVVIFLRDLFENVEFFRKEDLFEKNSVCFIDDWSHQEEALKSLEEIRSFGFKAALITQATGTGKTVIAVKDASKIGGRTLFIAHTVELISQAENQFQKHWQEGYNSDKVYCSTIQSMLGKIRQFPRDYFDYIVIDEAHHGAARTYRYLIEYFDPKFLLGLTATPDRLDSQNLEEIFGRIAHSLDLKTAIEQGKLVPIRALRVNTNISFDKIRVNRYDYTKNDLEKNLIVEDRDNIIFETYRNYIYGTGRKTVIFCVSVPHAKRLAELFKNNDINAKIVHGGMNRKERESVLKDYEYGNVNVLTSCSVLNEGWDSPVTSVLFMARPTMSKVLYMQQLGRGVRKYKRDIPSLMVAEKRATYGISADVERIQSMLRETEQVYNKGSLLVVDFVDNFMNMDPSWSVHAVFGLNHYRPGDYICCSDKKNMKIQPDFIQNLDLNLWVKSIEEIDPFTFEQKTGDMISSIELARELWIGDDTLMDYIKKEKIKPDKVLQVSNGRKVYFFKKDNIESIRQELGLKRRGIDTIKEDFFEFLEQRVYTFSFKIVFLRSFLMHINKKGIANIDSVLNSYMAFFLYLYNNHIKVETEKSPYNDYDYLTDKSKMKKFLLINPFEKFERRRLVNYCKDLEEIGFNNILWKQLEKEDLNRIMKQMEEDLIKYYKERLDIDLPAHVINYFKEG
jgi:superfamily II DNA or RNA helicase